MMTYGLPNPDITLDLLRKARDDVESAMDRTMKLCDTRDERIAIMLGVTHHLVIGVAVLLRMLGGRKAADLDDDIIMRAAIIAARSGRGEAEEVAALMTDAVAKVREGKWR